MLDYQRKLKGLEDIQQKFADRYDVPDLLCDLTMFAKDILSEAQQIVKARHSHAIEILEILHASAKRDGGSWSKTEKIFTEFVEELGEDKAGRQMVVDALFDLCTDESACRFLDVYTFDDLFKGKALPMIRKLYLIAKSYQ